MGVCVVAGAGTDGDFADYDGGGGAECGVDADGDHGGAGTADGGGDRCRCVRGASDDAAGRGDRADSGGGGADYRGACLVAAGACPCVASFVVAPRAVPLGDGDPVFSWFGARCGARMLW